MLKKSHTAQAFCLEPFLHLKFTCDGYVTMCCFHQRRCLGNILTSSLEDIWFSPLAKEIRKVTLEGRLHPTCQSENCPFFFKDKTKVETFLCDEYPTRFEFDLPTQHCNIGGMYPTKDNPACFMCERNLRKPEDFWQEDRLDEICKKLRPYTRNLDLLHIQGVAEPFWKDRIFKIIEDLGADRLQHRIRFTANTNGTLLTSAVRKKYLAFSKTNITWSVDAGTAQTYKKLRRTDLYDHVVKNLKAYGRERDQCNQFLHIHNNINLININEVVMMVELAADVGVNRLDFNPTYGVPEICVNEKNAHLFWEAQEKIVKRSKELGVYTTFMRNLPLNFLNVE